jgi:superfamily II DNA/RNA helicase
MRDDVLCERVCVELKLGGFSLIYFSFGNVDVEDVKFVINYDYPNGTEDYVHRIGRTGRSQKTGTAYTFFTHNNGKQAKDLVDVLKEANQVVNPKLFELMESSRGGYGGRNGCKL